MISIIYLPVFLKMLNDLPKELQEEVFEKVELFKNRKNHKALKVHKLKGHLKNRYSLYVNYQTRIVFIYESSKEAVFLAVGDHDVYK